MSRSYFIFIVLFLSVIVCPGQITFEKILGEGRGKYAEQTADGGYIACMDSGPDNYYFKLDRYGEFQWSRDTSFLEPGEKMNMIISKGNGFVACGITSDTSTVYDNLGYVVYLDSAGNILSHLLFQPGDSSGYVGAIRSTANGVAVSAYKQNIFGLDETYIQMIDTNGNTTWGTHANGGHIIPAMLNTDAANNFLFGYFDRVTREVAGFKLIDSSGTTLNEYIIGDTIMGGCLLQNAVPVGAVDGSYLFATQTTPFAHTTERLFLNRFDTTMNLLWTKEINWFSSLKLGGIIHTPDTGFILLINYRDSLSLYKINSNGDSLWMKRYGGIGKASGASINYCSDGGYVVFGKTDSLNGETYGYLLKTDSMGDILPSVALTLSGPSTFCNSGSVTIYAADSYSYQWSNGISADSITVSSTGTYHVEITDTITGNSAISPDVQITVLPLPLPVIHEDSARLISTLQQTYQWFRNGLAIAGADSQSFAPSIAGNYSVLVTDSNGCIGMSAAYPFSFTGINEAGNNELKINISDKNIRIISDNEIVSCSVYNLSGKEILKIENKFREYSGRCDALSAGVYFFKIQFQEEGMIKRFLYLE